MGSRHDKPTSIRRVWLPDCRWKTWQACAERLEDRLVHLHVQTDQGQSWLLPEEFMAAMSGVVTPPQ